MHYIISWVKTSSVNAYPVIHFTGTEQECNERFATMNFQHKLKIVDCIPDRY